MFYIERGSGHGHTMGGIASGCDGSKFSECFEDNVGSHGKTGEVDWPLAVLHIVVESKVVGP